MAIPLIKNVKASKRVWIWGLVAAAEPWFKCQIYENKNEQRERVGGGEIIRMTNYLFLICYPTTILIIKQYSNDLI